MCIASLLASRRQHQLSAGKLHRLLLGRLTVFTNEPTLLANRWRSFAGAPHTHTHKRKHRRMLCEQEHPKSWASLESQRFWCHFTHVRSRALTTVDSKHLSTTANASAAQALGRSALASLVAQVLGRTSHSVAQALGHAVLSHIVAEVLVRLLHERKFLALYHGTLKKTRTFLSVRSLAACEELQVISCGEDSVWRSAAKPPKTFCPTCTVSQQLGVPDCNDSESHLQEFSGAASGKGIRHGCQAMLLNLNIRTAPTRSSAACMKISADINRTNDKKTHFCVDRARSITTSACPSVMD